MAVKINNRLKEVLKEKGVSQTELANKMEVSNTAISNIITGKNLPSFELAMNIAYYLDVSVDDIFYVVRSKPSVDYMDLIMNIALIESLKQDEVISENGAKYANKDLVDVYIKKHGKFTLIVETMESPNTIEGNLAQEIIGNVLEEYEEQT